MNSRTEPLRAFVIKVMLGGRDMPLLVLLTSTIVLTLLPGWRSWGAGLAVTVGLLIWAYWPPAQTWPYGDAVYDYIIALGAPFLWLGFGIAMVGKIAWLARTSPPPVLKPICRVHSAGFTTHA
jgi:hypothetical protein